MSSFVAATVVLAGVAVYSAKEAKDAREEAKDEKARVEAAEKEKQAVIDAEIAAEKKAAGDKARKRLLRNRGHAGTVLGGKPSTPSPTLLGSVG